MTLVNTAISTLYQSAVASPADIEQKSNFLLEQKDGYLTKTLVSPNGFYIHVDPKMIQQIKKLKESGDFKNISEEIYMPTVIVRTPSGAAVGHYDAIHFLGESHMVCDPYSEIATVCLFTKSPVIVRHRKEVPDLPKITTNYTCGMNVEGIRI